jgi:hypothetical protein
MENDCDWVTIVTMCMGRLSQIQKTLPLNLALGFPVIFVDWSCPEHSGEWVEKTFPSVPVIKVTGEKYFSMCKPRNRGLALVQTPFVAFLDGDVFFKPQAKQWLNDTLKDRLTRWALMYGGSVVAPTQTCRDLGEWDEVFENWGAEDSEFWNRLDTKLICYRMSHNFWARLPHSDESRVSYFRVKEQWRSDWANHRYRNLLKEYRADGVEFTFEQRKKIYACIQTEYGIGG